MKGWNLSTTKQISDHHIERWSLRIIAAVAVLAGLTYADARFRAEPEYIKPFMADMAPVTTHSEPAKLKAALELKEMREIWKRMNEEEA